MNVAVNLLEYLKKHDNAELIGLGTFKVNYTPAFHSIVNNTISPPSRELIFSQDINNNLGFVDYMANNEFISQETAFSWISQYANGVIDKLNKFGTYKLGEIGVLNKQDNGIITLEPNSGLNLLEDSFAFSTLKNVKTFDKEDFIKPIQTNTKQDIEKNNIPDNNISDNNEIEKVIIHTHESLEHSKSEIFNSLNNEIGESKKEIISEQKQENPQIDLEQTKQIDIEFKDSNNNISIESNTEDSIKIHEGIDEDKIKKDKNKDKNSKQEEREKINSYVKKIREKHDKRRNKKLKKSKKKCAKKIWISIFILVTILLLGSAGLVFSHYMCYIKDVKFLEPITNRLNSYIQPKCTDSNIDINDVIPVETPIDNISEDSQVLEEGIEGLESNIVEQPIEKPITSKKTITKKISKPKISGEKDVPPPPSPQIDYTKPVLIQEMSRRGFDVIGGTFEQRSNAEQTSRKARSMGYDSYIIQRQKDGNPIYYVSYGSRDTYSSANYFMNQISEKTGYNDLYIISR